MTGPWHFARSFHADSGLPSFRSIQVALLPWKLARLRRDGGREIERPGRGGRLIPPIHIKPFDKRQKNDAADAEAIVEAAVRPTLRLVALKTAGRQARAMLFRTRQLFIGQRTRLINAPGSSLSRSRAGGIVQGASES